ncbi:RNA polymerase sigma-70 factor (ECF subfamily) [Ancylomarina subtilis]|uniref:RNA polymerase sigma-70 factor (ECF subfamily) n=1 Tax=Ancylomarina subtilis TaxID=1639035 RepID=A0A4Q7VJT9_9BACT|nr:RNA polymerase sigma-70 factor [Ancylomarina subtilis]RZT96453.1 RNA polymerase sigma-70 factor (ECF subfamily) [Ancylomarina subtilis]
MDSQEQDIIRKFKSGDESGLRLLFDLYYSSLCVFAYKYFDSYEKAEDVVQEAFITLWEKNRLINFTGSIKSYLFSIVRNNSINKIKEDRKYRFEEIENQSYAIIEDKFESESLEKRREKLYREIEMLPEQCKKVFEAIVFEKMKYADVAAELNVSLNTVKTHYSRALKQLRSSLDVLLLIMLP